MFKINEMKKIDRYKRQKIKQDRNRFKRNKYRWEVIRNLKRK